jgi:hypothetical protein
VRLAGQEVTVYLTDDGKAVLELASVKLPDSNLFSVLIEESEDLGLWLRLPRKDQIHLFLLRWEYILGIDLPSGLAKVVGLKG